MKEYLEKIETVLQRYTEVMRILSDPDVIHNRERFLEYSRERAQLEELQSLYDNYRRAMKEYEENQELLQSEDSEIAALANEEIPSLEKRLKEDERALLVGILPPDPAAKNSAIVEIRAGTGGEEAALFAGSLFRMYNRYSDIRHWKTEILDSNPTDLGGFKEIVFKIKGKGAYGALKYEGGVHRVQRVPETEASGRIHTSSASVVVLPEITADMEIDISPEDIKIDVYRASGAGGQHVNRTESAVRITHLPTGIVVTCQNERSQHQNKLQALDVLKAKLYEIRMSEEQQKLSQKRKHFIGTGNRNEKIRTYNYPQSRLTDHRVNYTSYQLQAFLDGDIDELLAILQEEDTIERLKEVFGE
ncbi:MAG TPA: peptide chain release factor 1 [Thermotogota bacterium]|jgi:peptide chain release factor 1|nr:peptide chain release factor 1 [Thermotogota bacterium]OQC31222.1 MAG: Peptide chain release factor 1 [Thermotogota bacterium ADurb.Bin062]HNW46284.1 peptide chain release factor 1 [Thermotogota bacterium]HOD91333.1 peptide chain release factor 1 [Thermotogota bacterium]HOF23978.1 peptide chain release factor 1 [Thermotogota bacterium]